MLLKKMKKMKNKKRIVPIVAMVIMCIVFAIIVRKSGEPLSVDTMLESLQYFFLMYLVYIL